MPGRLGPPPNQSPKTGLCKTALKSSLQALEPNTSIPNRAVIHLEYPTQSPFSPALQPVDSPSSPLDPRQDSSLPKPPTALAYPEFSRANRWPLHLGRP